MLTFIEITEIGGEAIMEGIISQCVFMHESVRQKCIRYKTVLNRYNYVTPKSYLELLSLFRKLLDQKRNELHGLRNRTATGLDKLLAATKEVELLQEELANAQPMLIQTSKDTEEAMVSANMIAEYSRSKSQPIKSKRLKFVKSLSMKKNKLQSRPRKRKPLLMMLNEIWMKLYR